MGVLDYVLDDAESVVDAPLGLIDDPLGSAAYEYADGLRVLAALDEDELVRADLLLLDGVGVADVRGG